MWAITRDRLRAAEVVSHLSGGAMHTGSLEAFLSIHQALSAIDRLEVRAAIALACTSSFTTMRSTLTIR